MRRPHIPPPASCEQHRTSSFQAGCPDCRRYSRVRRQIRMWDRWTGENMTALVDAEQTRRTLYKLREAGVPWKEISCQTGVWPGHLRAIKAGRVRRVVRRTEVAVLCVDPAGHAAPPSHLVDSTGPIRMLEGLAWMGYSAAEVGRMIGVSTQTVQWYSRQRQLYRSSAEKIEQVYRSHSMTFSTGERAKWTHTRAVNRGFAPPMAWDDDTIHDPAARPQVAPSEQLGEFDELAVLLAVTWAQSGKMVPDRYKLKSKADRVEATARILEQGGNANSVLRLLDCNGQTAARMVALATQDSEMPLRERLWGQLRAALGKRGA